MNISRFRDKILLPEDEFNGLLRQRSQARWLAAALRDRLSVDHALLLNALHQLALERGAKDPSRFARDWVREHRQGIEP